MPIVGYLSNGEIYVPSSQAEVNSILDELQQRGPYNTWVRQPLGGAPMEGDPHEAGWRFPVPGDARHTAEAALASLASTGAAWEWQEMLMDALSEVPLPWTVPDVAAATGVSERHMFRLARQKLIPERKAWAAFFQERGGTRRRR